MTMLRRLLPLAFLIPLVLSGCDAAEEEDDVFPLTSERPAGFTYMDASLAAGETFVSAPVTQLSQPIINDGRFEPSDVASARIREGSVRLNMDFPFGPENAVVVTGATLVLSAPGLGERVVARGADITLAINSTTAPQRQVLEVANADITDYLRREDFQATLRLDVAESSDVAYQFTVAFEVDIDVTVQAANQAVASF